MSVVLGTSGKIPASMVLSCGLVLFVTFVFCGFTTAVDLPELAWLELLAVTVEVNEMRLDADDVSEVTPEVSLTPHAPYGLLVGSYETAGLADDTFTAGGFDWQDTNDTIAIMEIAAPIAIAFCE